MTKGMISPRRGRRSLTLLATISLACTGSTSPRPAAMPPAAPNTQPGLSDRLPQMPVGFGGRFDVRNFGAKGDGVTIDSDAINRAIENAAVVGGGIYGFFVRHAADIRMDGVEVGFMSSDTRPAFVLDDVRGIELHGVRAPTAPNVPAFVLRDVEEFRVTHSAPLRDTYVKRAARQSF